MQIQERALRFRPFARPADFAPMVACANASFAADGTGFFRTVDEVARDYAAFTDCVPTRDVWIAQAGTEVAGYVRAWHFAQADGLHLYAQFAVVAPPWRGQGVGRALHAWLEARQREMARAHPQATAHAHHAFVTEGERARIALLERSGYVAERHFFTMVRPSLDDIALHPLPAGLEVRAVRAEDCRAIWDAHQQAFQTHWGHSPADEADFQRWLGSPQFQPQLWQVAWDVQTGEVAGQVRTFIDATWNQANQLRRGWTEFISVGPRWRRRGLARALIARSLLAQREAGMRESGLGVDAQNLDGANRIYEASGFRVVKRNAVYRKPLNPADGDP